MIEEVLSFINESLDVILGETIQKQRSGIAVHLLLVQSVGDMEIRVLKEGSQYPQRLNQFLDG